MSGGSFDYLCYVDGASDLLDRRGDVESMRVALSNTGYSDKEAEETQELLDLLEEVENKLMNKVGSLKDVWKALEWWHSQDYTEEGFRAALEKHRKSKLKLGDPCPECETPLKTEEGSEGTPYLYCYKDGYSTL
jgi:hypothetical protein